MLEQLKNEANLTLTENFAVTYKSAGNECLDLFATIGALRNSEPEQIQLRFMRAFAENPDLALRTAFYARDIRQGLGERKVFRVILEWLAKNNPDSITENIALIPEYGRWDDLLCLLDTNCRNYALNLIKSNLESDSLISKWLPSINASSQQTRHYAHIIAKFLEMNSKQYRQLLTGLRAKLDLIENNLREKNYTFDYSKQPSKAMFKYRQAFIRNDGKRYNKFLEDVAQGKSSMNTGTLAPYEIILPFVRWKKDEISESERKAINTTWEALEDFTNGENALAVIDGSASMYRKDEIISPISVALSLGIYFAERSTGEFHNHFITFSENPQLVAIKGNDIYERVNYCKSFDEIANTNLQKVFELILNTAVKNNIPPEQMPARLYIISDMEFDSCTEDSSLTNFEYAKKIFSEHNYNLPQIIFWNADSRHLQQPVTFNEQGVCLVSGVSPRVFAMIKRVDLTPLKFMLDILNSERYVNICA
ncbi:MAG: DUF2828 family protein [Synergistaceae bacterium]|nr:DUF2828 family protein [Synergistaceae bacterium]